MRRREFIAGITAPAIAAATAGRAFAVGENRKNEQYGPSAVKKASVSGVGGKSFQELRDFHRKELDQEYIKLWDKSGIDWEYGGFFPDVNADGAPKYTEKEMYYQGRGLWVFSYIYNHFEKHERHLKAARLARNFLVKNCRDERGYWNSKFTREGKTLEGSFNIYGDMYMVLGLGEYYKATGCEESRKLAIESAYGVMERIVSPSYQHLAGHGAANEPGCKRLGTWQHFLSTLTPLLRYTTDEGVERIARMCVRNILERHWHPELGVAFERLDDNWEPYRADPMDNDRVISGWHSIQAAWMCMDEALRRGHPRMFIDAMEMGRVTLEKCWVDGKKYSGLISINDSGVRPVEPSDVTGIPSGATDDALIFCLMAIEHTQEAWALRWYDKVLKAGYSYPNYFKRRCLLHHPRRLFHSIEILDHLIARGGQVSGFLDKA